MISHLQTVRLSRQEVDILNTLKRRFKINQWNILCRIAFSMSCSIPLIPPVITFNRVESVVAIDWDTFTGEMNEIYGSILIAHRTKYCPSADIVEYFYRILHRGILLIQTNKPPSNGNS